MLVEFLILFLLSEFKFCVELVRSKELEIQRLYIRINQFVDFVSMMINRNNSD